MSDAGILHSTAAACVRCTSRLLGYLPSRERVDPGGADFFYAAELATLRLSGFDDVAHLQAGVPGTYAPFFKAAFLDRVTRDERDAMQFQFRPLGLATRVGVRTTGMEGTA